MHAELWNPATGDIRGIADARAADGTTRVPLTLGADEMVFVVFRAASAPAAGAAP